MRVTDSVRTPPRAAAPCAILKLLRASGPLRTGQIASRIGAHSETVAQAMSALRAADVVRRRGNDWHLVDHGAEVGS